MGTKKYGQLSLNERVEICRLHAGGKSLRKIAKATGRSASTVSRELQRNSRPTKAWVEGYDPVRAQGLAERRRRWDGRYKLMRQPALRSFVRERLAMGWSPEQIAGRLKHEHGRIVISHESIYRFVYHKSAQKDYWHRLLPRRKSRRGRLGQRGGSPANLMQRRVSIHERPPEVDARQSAGHWEADLMQFRDYKVLLVTHERLSRFLNIAPQPDKHAKPTAARLARQMKRLPAALRKTMTFDNGTEFAMHYRLQDDLGMQTFFCDTHSPWQKGGIENAIGRLRRSLPRKTNLDTVSKHKLLKLLCRHNSTPRKCLGFKTPAEVFFELQRRVALQS